MFMVILLYILIQIERNDDKKSPFPQIYYNSLYFFTQECYLRLILAYSEGEYPVTFLKVLLK